MTEHSLTNAELRRNKRCSSCGYQQDLHLFSVFCPQLVIVDASRFGNKRHFVPLLHRETINPRKFDYGWYAIRKPGMRTEFDVINLTYDRPPPSKNPESFVEGTLAHTTHVDVSYFALVNYHFSLSWVPFFVWLPFEWLMWDSQRY